MNMMYDVDRSWTQIGCHRTVWTEIGGGPTSSNTKESGIRFQSGPRKTKVFLERILVLLEHWSSSLTSLVSRNNGTRWSVFKKNHPLSVNAYLCGWSVVVSSWKKVNWKTHSMRNPNCCIFYRFLRNTMVISTTVIVFHCTKIWFLTSTTVILYRWLQTIWICVV